MMTYWQADMLAKLIIVAAVLFPVALIVLAIVLASRRRQPRWGGQIYTGRDMSQEKEVLRVQKEAERSRRWERRARMGQAGITDPDAWFASIEDELNQMNHTR